MKPLQYETTTPTQRLVAARAGIPVAQPKPMTPRTINKGSIDLALLAAQLHAKALKQDEPTKAAKYLARAAAIFAQATAHGCRAFGVRS